MFWPRHRTRVMDLTFSTGVFFWCLKFVIKRYFLQMLGSNYFFSGVLFLKVQYFSQSILYWCSSRTPSPSPQRRGTWLASWPRREIPRSRQLRTSHLYLLTSKQVIYVWTLSKFSYVALVQRGIFEDLYVYWSWKEKISKFRTYSIPATCMQQLERSIGSLISSAYTFH